MRLNDAINEKAKKDDASLRRIDGQNKFLLSAIRRIIKELISLRPAINQSTRLSR